MSVTRREWLRSGAAVTALVVIGCRKDSPPPTCTSTQGLSPEDAAARTTLAYEDRAADPARACEKCVQYVEAPSADACGGCKVLKGPISRAGTCKVFAAKS